MGRKSKIEKFNALLLKYKKRRDFVKIYRKFAEGEANIYGIILENSSDFLHLRENDDFHFKGEVIIRCDDFSAIRCNKFEKTIKHILEAEKKLSKSKPKSTLVDLSSWSSIFKSLKAKEKYVIIECENLNNPTFTIGAIENVKSKSVEIRNFDATGKIDKEATKIKYKNITLLKFNDEYVKTFRKYLRT